MQFRDTVLKRRIVRNFTPDPVPPEALDDLLALAMRAPSAGYSQGQAFVSVTRPDLRMALAELCGESQYVNGGFHPFLSAAPDVPSPSLKRGRTPRERVIHHNQWQTVESERAGEDR